MHIDYSQSFLPRNGHEAGMSHFTIAFQYHSGESKGVHMRRKAQNSLFTDDMASDERVYRKSEGTDKKKLILIIANFRIQGKYKS